MIKDKNLKKYVNKFRKKKILVVGDLMLDEYIWGEVSRVSPEAPVPVVKVERETFSPGGAGNVATNIRSLGGEPYLLGVVGEDPQGRKLLSLLEGWEINLEGVEVEKERPTTCKTRIIARSQHMLRVDREKISPLKKRGDFLKNLRKFISLCEGVIISDYGKGMITPSLSRLIIQEAKRGEKPVVVDPQVNHTLQYREASFITPNHLEAVRMARIEAEKKEDYLRAGKKLLKRLNLEGVVLTWGKEGMWLILPEKKPLHIPTVARQVYDVTGAGDTVTAVFTLSLLSGANPEESAWLANLGAGKVIEKTGTATLTPQELKEQIDFFLEFKYEFKTSV